MLERIKSNFTENIQTAIAASEALSSPIEHAGMIMVNALLNGNKIFTCGIGGSACNAQHLSFQLLNKYETERPSLPSITLAGHNSSLTSVGDDFDYHDIFSKQLRALASNGDVLVAISTSGNAKTVIKAIESAVSRDMPIIALTGTDGGDMAGLLGENDVEIRVPSSRVPRIQEVHLLIIHSLCDLIDSTLFPQAED